MNKILVALTLALTACSISDPDPIDAVSVNHGPNALPVLSFTADEAAELSDDGDQPRGESAVCSCDGPDCIEAWVRDNVGCDVCILVDCGALRIGACATCEDSGPEIKPNAGTAMEPRA